MEASTNGSDGLLLTQSVTNAGNNAVAFGDGVNAHRNGGDGLDISQDTSVGANSVTGTIFVANNNTNRGFAVNQSVRDTGTNSIASSRNVGVNVNGDEGAEFVSERRY